MNKGVFRKESTASQSNTPPNISAYQHSTHTQPRSTVFGNNNTNSSSISSSSSSTSTNNQHRHQTNASMIVMNNNANHFYLGKPRTKISEQMFVPYVGHLFTCDHESTKRYVYYNNLEKNRRTKIYRQLIRNKNEKLIKLINQTLYDDDEDDDDEEYEEEDEEEDENEPPKIHLLITQSQTTI